MRRFALGTVLTGILAVATAIAGVTVDYDRVVDFSKYKTYAWKEGTPAANPLNEERIHRAVAAQLAQKGLAEAKGEADCYVYTHVSNKEAKNISFDTFGYGGYRGWRGWGGGWGTTSVNVSNYIEGTLVVDIVDAGTNQLAWRGLGTKTLYPNTKPEKLEQIINKAAARMFKSFPPKPKK